MGWTKGIIGLELTALHLFFNDIGASFNSRLNLKVKI